MKLDDEIFTDNTSVQLESHRKTSYHKVSQPSRLCGKPKHPVKVHVLSRIPCQGVTQVVIFTGIMKVTSYTDILDSALVLFLEHQFPMGHQFQ